MHPSQNRVAELFIGRLLRHLPTTIRPLLLADRGFGRTSLIQFLQAIPHYTGYLVDYVIRLKGDPVSSTGQAVVSGYLPLRPSSGVRMYRMRMQPEQYFKSLPRATTRGPQATLRAEPERRNHHPPLQRLLVGLLLACCLLILVGLRASPTFRRQVCSRGKLGILNLGYEFYLATPDPPDNPFTIHHHQTGYA